MQNPKHPILVADDIKTNLLFIGSCLKSAGYNNMIECQDSSRIMDLLAEQPAEIILLDLRMPPPDGITLLPRIRQAFPELPVIIVTDISDVKTAVQCMREGAFDYITKPVDRDLFRITINRALAFRNLQRENRELKKTVYTLDDLKKPEAFSSMITASPNMVRIFHYIEAVAESREPVLITGETGVGKELVAKVIHTLSGRTGNLVPVNVAGLDDSMFSDTLFGHIAGAFTGADKTRNGLIETAGGGTLFLDEIGDLSPLSQVKLLRLLQENEYMPLGMDTVKRSLARIIVATNEDLWALQKQGRFRKDLIYRLKTHHIHVPALGERRCDIPLLVHHFLDQGCARQNRKKPLVSKELMTCLVDYPFPGNVRELQAMVFDALSRSGGAELIVDHFSHHFVPGRAAGPDDRRASGIVPGTLVFPEPLPTIKEATEGLVNEAMKRARGKQTQAASMLGISQPALNKRLKKINHDT
ncbi:MAG: sigma-54 dependent transcriptional regulator [Proteobacteria bacterium]|nr:sigma-54 dependent transcriptional regulator [Pseudomonadota bacterium]